MGKYVNGIAVYEYGDRNNTPIIFIHGFPYNSTMWAQQIKKLKESYYCIAYDVRGLGDTPPGDGQFTMEMFVDDLFSVIESLDLEKPVVTGFSMGGYITLRAAEREPERFRALILCDTKAEADDDAARIKRAGAISTIDKDGLETFTSSFIPITFGDDAPQQIPESYNAILEQATNESPVGVKGCLLAMAARTDTSATLGNIDVPTLLLVGEDDALTPPSVMKEMHEKIAESDLVTIPGVGHMSPVESPEVVTQNIQEFLSRSI